MIVWKKIWNYLKHYWWLLLFPIGILIGIWLVVTRGSDSLKHLLQITNESHRMEKEVIEESTKKLQLDKKNIREKHKLEKAKLDVAYKNKVKKIKEKKKADIAELTERFKEDPKGLAKEYAEEFGLDLTGLDDE